MNNSSPSTASTDQQHVVDMLKDFSVVMLATRDEAQSELKARPMSVADRSADGSLFFVTRRSSQKVDEAASAPDSYVFAQSKTQYLSLRGTTEIVDDRDKLHDIWSKIFDAWFEGPDDPEAVLMVFHPQDAELWDSSGARGLKFLFDTAKALMGGDKQTGHDGDQHARVGM